MIMPGTSTMWIFAFSDLHMARERIRPQGVGVNFSVTKSLFIFHSSLFSQKLPHLFRRPPEVIAIVFNEFKRHIDSFFPGQFSPLFRALVQAEVVILTGCYVNWRHRSRRQYESRRP